MASDFVHHTELCQPSDSSRPQSVAQNPLAGRAELSYLVAVRLLCAQRHGGVCCRTGAVLPGALPAALHTKKGCPQALMTNAGTGIWWWGCVCATRKGKATAWLRQKATEAVGVYI